jgi:ankyrin repeat protein
MTASTPSITVDAFKDAAWAGDWEVVRAYVAAGGDVNACASNGVNALVALDPEMLDFLYQHGADPASVWSDGNPAICFHAWEVNVEGLKWFLNKGVNPDVFHRETGESCLHSLTAKPSQLEKRHDAIELLLNCGANVNVQTKTGVLTGNFMRDICVVGETALHRAAAYQSKATIELLLTHGADKTIKDSRNESALSWASRHWRPRDILKLLTYGEFENSIR